METLTRPKERTRPATSTLLASSIPAPFPRELLPRVHIPEEQTETTPLHEEGQLLLDTQAGPSRSQTDEKESTQQQRGDALHELMPSIAYVQKSCLMTLNNLLSAPTGWTPIVPDRRHSMPSTPQATNDQQTDPVYPSSALQTLLSNLRNRDATSEMLEFRPGSSDSELIVELATRVRKIAHTLEPADARLATAIASLLTHFDRLTVVQAKSPTPLTRTTKRDSWAAPESIVLGDPIDALQRQLSEFQSERLSSIPEARSSETPPVLAVEAALLWSAIDEELEDVVTMCRERTEDVFRSSLDHLPPQYEAKEYDVDDLPEYEVGARTSLDQKNHIHANAMQSPVSASNQTSEKMRLDLEAVSMAIDRLYMVAPQLNNQRAELKPAKLAQMERARQQGATPSARSLGKQKQRDNQDLEHMFELLSKASERSLKDQSVMLEPGMQNKMEMARQRGEAERAAFVEQLAEHSNAGRFHGQDAAFQSKTKNPDALLSLPEFIREAIPMDALRIDDPQTLLTLPEFVSELPPPHIFQPQPRPPSTKTKKKNRNRSLSAPSLSWLRSASRSSNPTTSNTPDPKSKSSQASLSPAGFDVHFVAENHENLQHSLMFMTITGSIPGQDVEVEVLPPFPEPLSESGDRVLVRSGPRTSLPLCLPSRTTPGPKEVKVQSGHFEVKFGTHPLSHTPSEEHRIPLLDAPQLSQSSPSTFICASCSLPVVQSSQVMSYRDLPSEHWEELVEAWMCHSDQKLHEEVSKQSKGGFWPTPVQALVGGSYIIFDASSMLQNNLCAEDEKKRGEEWRLVRCLCGAVIGRCQEHTSDESLTTTAYRLLKYAIRPVSPTSDPIRIPLSAFIVEDMMEFVQAHATYRFVITDDEDELPRILIWLFKPSIRISYCTPAPYALPKSASIHAAKILYKILSPSERVADLKIILNKYPGFPQAEFLSYPISVCRRLAGLLKESTTAYPESLRTMTGLSVGFLQRY